MLDENATEAAQTLRDTFEDAILMGVEEHALRRRLHAMVDALVSPKRQPAS